MSTYTTAGTHKATYGTAKDALMTIYRIDAQLECQARDAYYDARAREDELIQGLRFEQWLKATEATNKSMERWYHAS